MIAVEVLNSERKPFLLHRSDFKQEIVRGRPNFLLKKVYCIIRIFPSALFLWIEYCGLVAAVEPYLFLLKYSLGWQEAGLLSISTYFCHRRILLMPLVRVHNKKNKFGVEKPRVESRRSCLSYCSQHVWPCSKCACVVGINMNSRRVRT